MNRLNTICLLGLVIPVLVGSFIYISSGSGTYLYDWANKMGITVRAVKYPQIIRNFGCDFLWGYALLSGLRLFEDKSRSPAKSVLVSLIAVVFLETIQLSDSIPGVFDPLDILVETTAVLSALFITNHLGRTNDEKNN